MTVITLTMIIMINAVWLQNNQSRTLCDWIDNNLIAFFAINKFSTRNLKSILHAAHLSLLFSIENNSKTFQKLLGQSSRESAFKKRYSENMRKFTGEHQCQSVISIKLLKQLYWNCTSTLVFSCKYAAYFQKPFPRNTTGWLLLKPIVLIKYLDQRGISSSYDWNNCNTRCFF